MVRSLVGVATAIAVAVSLGACHGPPHGTVFVVTTTADGADAVPGDGVCEATVGLGDCTLRAAITEGNAVIGGNSKVVVPAGDYVLTVLGVDDANASGDLDLDPAGGVISVVAETAGVMVDAGGAEAVFDLRAGVGLISGVGITGATGAGVNIESGATIGLAGLAVSGAGGPGIDVAAGGAAELRNVTVTGNAGAGSAVAGSLDLLFSTVTANGAGGVTGAGAVTAEASVLAGQAAGADCSGPITSADFNLDSDGSCGLGQPGDASGLAAGLGPAASTPSPYHHPLSGSPVIDAVPAAGGTCSTSHPVGEDQRGVVRPAGAACDRGAVEAAAAAFTVDTASDGVDAVPGDGRCDDGTGACPLRAAIGELNMLPADDHEITLAADPVLSISGTEAAPDNDQNDLDVESSFTLVGEGHIVDADDIDRVLQVSGGTTTLEHVTITGGFAAGSFAPEGSGGGVLVDAAAAMVVVESTVTGNRANAGAEISNAPPLPAVAAGGGGIAAFGPLTVERSTISNNTGPPHAACGGPTMPTCWVAYGGGILARDTLVVTDSTITGNTVGWTGGGIDVSGGDALIARSTISGNEVANAYVIEDGDALSWGYDAFGDAFTDRWISATILEGTDEACYGAPTASFGYNLASDATCSLGHATDLETSSANLAPLADNGGPTLTRLPLAPSAAIGAIPGADPSCSAVPPDQRGVARPQGTDCDIGAVEQ